MGDGGPIQVSHKFPVIFLMGAICIWFEVISFDDFSLIAGTFMNKGPQSGFYLKLLYH